MPHTTHPKLRSKSWQRVLLMNSVNVPRRTWQLTCLCTPPPFRLTRNKLKLFIYKLISPGWTWTKLAGNNGTNPKPQGAWTAEETVLYMLDKVRGGEFYVLVPDNETKRELISWGSCGQLGTLQRVGRHWVGEIRIITHCMMNMWRKEWRRLTIDPWSNIWQGREFGFCNWNLWYM